MIPIRLICAWSDVEKANAVARLLVAEGFSVTIRHMRAETELDPPDARICDIVIWSPDSVNSWPVLEQAEAAFYANRLVQLSVHDAQAPLKSSLAPIDFTHWSNERGPSWRTLRERIDRVGRGEDAAVSPMAPASALAAASFSILALAISNRYGDGLPDQQANALPDQFAAAADLPQVDGAAGGPPIMEEILVTEELRPMRSMRGVRMLRTASLPALPNLAEAPPTFRSPEIIRPSLLRRVLNAAEELPFVSVSEEQSAS